MFQERGAGAGGGERQIVMVLPDDAMLASSSLLPSFSTCGKKGLRPRFFGRKALGVVVVGGGGVLQIIYLRLASA